jgi:hypothetical protein
VLPLAVHADTTAIPDGGLAGIGGQGVVFGFRKGEGKGLRWTWMMMVRTPLK